MQYSFDPQAAFGKIAGLNPPGASGATPEAFGGMLNVAPLTPGFTGAQQTATNPYPQGTNESMLWMMENIADKTATRTRNESKQDLAEIMAQRKEEFKEAATYKTLAQIPSMISSIGQGLAATLYNPERIRIMSQTPGLLASMYAQDSASPRKKYIS
jgi:hypothetical protein